ncbi:MAG: HAMP domain-containing protein [Legionellales bacterium]|nr:HAMP domain-containing protein [Legionellales bacterium]
MLNITSLYPQSLLSRTIFVIMLILVLSQLLSNMLVHHLVIKPRAQQHIMTLGENLQSIHSALLTLPDRQRYIFVKYLASKQRFKVTGDHEWISQLPRLVDYPQFRTLLANYLPKPPGQEQLDIRYEAGKENRYWVNLPVANHNYWVGFSASRVRSTLPKELVIWLICTLLFTLGGSYWLVSRINRSLRKLSNAAQSIGQGRQVDILSEHGPTEIRLLTRAFNKMHHDIELLTRNRTLLLAGVSHDLRTPLARMRLNLEMIESTNLAQTKAELVQDIEDMDNILEQFLLFVREGSEETPCEININEIIKAVAERYRRNGQTIDMELAADLLSVMAKPIAIQRVVMNLIDNAMKYAGKSTIQVTTRLANDIIEILVSDHGPGVPVSQRKRLLEPFTQLFEGEKSPGGTGLGLAIAKRIIENHGGSIQLQENDGGGLTVMIQLPIYR